MYPDIGTNPNSMYQPITISAEPDLSLSNGLAWGACCLADPSLTLWTSRIPCTWKLCCLQETLNSRRKPIYIQNGRSWLIPRPASFPSWLRIASQWVDANCPLPIHVQICFSYQLLTFISTITAIWGREVFVVSSIYNL